MRIGKHRPHRLLCLLLAVVLAVSMACPALAYGECGFGSCTCTGCSAVVHSYVSVGDSGHYITYECSGGCGAWGGSSLDGVYSHSFSSSGYCSYCGYACSHSDWDSFSNGCVSGWYCNICGYTSYSGSHSYVYGPYSYYNSTQHRCYYYCQNCSASGTTGYSYADHKWSYTGSWQYNDTQHYRQGTCSGCGYSGLVYQDHTYRYSGSWTYDENGHYRQGSCSTCGWSGTVSEAHNYRYGSWSKYSSTQHRRTCKCKTCGYSGYEYADHNWQYGSWIKSGDQHYRTKRCTTCGYSEKEYADHVWTYSNCKSISDTQHSCTMTCSACGYATTGTTDHTLVRGTCTPCEDDNTQHDCLFTCADCSYTETQTEPHTLSYGAWEQEDEEQHDRTCDCALCGYSGTEYETHSDGDEDGYCDDCSYEMVRFSVSVPTELTIVMAEDGTVHSSAEAAIENYSTGTVEVSSVTVGTVNGWVLVPCLCNMADVHVDSKQISFCVNDCWTTTTGTTQNLALAGDWTIPRNGNLGLDYDAKISATSVALDEQVLYLIFVVRWNE